MTLVNAVATPSPKERHHQSHEWSTTATAFSVTRRDQEWLMIRHERLGATSWELPGGHVDPGETLEEAAARESLEETGVSVEVAGLLAVCVHEWQERRQRKLCFFDAIADAAATPRLSPGEPEIRTPPGSTRSACRWTT